MRGFEDIELKLSQKAEANIDRLLAYLKRRHTDRPIKSWKLERIFGLPGPQVRQIVGILRRRGEPIASSSKGYAYCSDPVIGLNDTISHLSQRRDAIDADIEGLLRAQSDDGLGDFTAEIMPYQRDFWDIWKQE